MVSTASTLPDNIEGLKEIARHYEVENNILREQVRLLKSKLYGRKTEKNSVVIDDGQSLLFNEVEEFSSPEKEEREEVEVPAHKRKKRGRRPLPDDLPTVDIIHDLSEEEKICACGCKKSRIGEEVTKQLDIIPARIQIVRNIRYKYVCKNCEGVEADEPAVKIAPLPPRIIPKSIATPGLLSHILTSKFVDALPFYRQERQFERMGVDISRSNMCNWAIKVAEKCEPLMTLIGKEIRSGPLINIDETTVQVMKEPGRSNTTKSYMWIFRGGDPDRPLLIYQYHPTRSGDVASDFLDGYKGYVQTDGYSGYDFIDHILDMIHVGCWAHARRNFVDAIKASGKHKSSKGKISLAEEGLRFIRKLYEIEKDVRARKLSYEDIYKERQEKAKPVLDEFKAWLDSNSIRTPPKGLLGKAISYTLTQWDRLIIYLENGILKPDNNIAENAIRPFVVGRKNWLFSGNPKGAKASASLYSLIESAKANNLEPYRYLRFLFQKLPFADSVDDYTSLLPNRIDQSALPAL